MDVPAEVTQEDDHTELLHLPSPMLALIFLAKRIQPVLSLVDREVDFFVYGCMYVSSSHMAEYGSIV